MQLGLQGFDPATFDTDQIPHELAKIKQSQTISIGKRSIPFIPQRDIQFILGVGQPHPNTMTLTAQLSGGELELIHQHLIQGSGFALTEETGQNIQSIAVGV